VVRNVIDKRQIDMKKGKEILARLDEVPDPIISARQFIAMNFDALRRSGKTLRALHQFLLSNGLDVGSYEYFQAVYNSVKRARKIDPIAPASLEAISEKAEPEKSAPTPPKVEKIREVAKAPKRLPGLGLRPIYLADGTEIEIDPETGAKRFKIKSNRRTEE
jgi:hypothetical protein